MEWEVWLGCGLGLLTLVGVLLARLVPFRSAESVTWELIEGLEDGSVVLGTDPTENSQ